MKHQVLDIQSKAWCFLLLFKFVVGDSVIYPPHRALAVHVLDVRAPQAVLAVHDLTIYPLQILSGIKHRQKEIDTFSISFCLLLFIILFL